MYLTSLHILLTYQCVFECGHCFIWGHSRPGTVFDLDRLDVILDQVMAAGTVRELYYEGGETFVYYPILIAAVRHATARHLDPTVVTNGYWAKSVEQARVWLGRLADAGLERIQFAAGECVAQLPNADTHPGLIAARQLGLEASIVGSSRLSLDGGSYKTIPENPDANPPTNERGLPWGTFTACPYEGLAGPAHLHVDPSGNLHVCPGLVIGNLFECQLQQLVSTFQPERHPITGRLLAGGPAELVQTYGLEVEATYVDACQLCQSSLAKLRERSPGMFGPSGRNRAEVMSDGWESEPVAG